jgi:F-type H+-transporting ATPase subunit delta
LLGNPKLTDADAVKLLAPEPQSESFARFLTLLADNRRLGLLPEIAGLYEELRAEAERVVKATVTSAVVLPAGELDKITAALRQRFGREVEVDTAIDASLIGGAVIDAGDVVIDGSLKGKLERLQAALAG